MDDAKLLRIVYSSIDWKSLYELAPEVERGDVDELFARLRKALERGAGAESLEGEERGPVDTSHLVLRCDGASRGNPGPAGIGVALTTPDGQEVAAWGDYVGETTNNVAEYRALVAGLARARELGAEEIDVRSDSQLMVRQLKGEYQVKSDRLREHYVTAKRILEQFERTDVKHVPREENKRADGLATKAVKDYQKRQKSG
jgi:ribonuclease HI